MNKIIKKLIKKEKKRQEIYINLIASENITSNEVMKINGSILTNKYAEGIPGKRYYGGCKIIDTIESIAIERLKKIFNASYANVQPHSGSQANYAIMLSILNPGDKILGFNLSHGGHLSHGSNINFSGKLYKSYFYGVNKKTGLINWKEVEKITKKEKPKLIITGASSYARDWDYKKFKKISDNIGSFLIADISHTAGFIAKGLLNNPIPYCHFITSTTHKTLKGPRGGIILSGKNFNCHTKLKIKNIENIINKGIFPGAQGGPLENTIAAKSIAFKEILTDKYLKYILQVKINANEMAKLFIKIGYKILTNGTDNHIILIDLRNKKINGKIAENILIKSGIVVNKNLIPFDNQSANITSGIRLGTSYITSIGIKKKDIKKIVEFIDKTLNNYKKKKILKKIKKEVHDWMEYIKNRG